MYVLNCTNSLKNAIIMKTVIIFTLLLLYGGLLAVSKELCSMHRAARDSTRTGNYIVQLHDNVSDSSFNRTIERAVSLSQNKRLYMVVRYIEKAFVVNLNYYTALEICHWKEVKSVEEETEVVGAQDINLSWYLDELDQGPNHLKDHQYRPIGTGSGIDAYILDSGINYDHEDFENRAKYPGYDPMDQYYSDQPPRYGSDCQGHGTHVASLLGGKRFGSAKKVTLFSVRVLNCYNAAPWSVVIDGMDHVMKLINKRKRPSIVCMSLGGPTQPAADEAVKRLAELGVIVVVAAGNNKGDACIRSPAGSPHVITVGATNSTYGLYWRYSGTNYGSCVDIFAPGEFIEAAGMDCNNCTRILSGTSMATPLVGGIAAILLQDQPLLTPSDMKQLLVSSSLTDIIDFNSLTPEQSTITPNKFLNIKGSCGGIYSIRTSMNLTSPSYPEDYPSNLDCQWTIPAGHDEDISITISDLDLEDGYDYLILCKGNKDCNHDNVTRYTGTIRLSEGGSNGQAITYRSSNANITLRLITDGYGSGRGFKMNFTKYYTNTPLKVPDNSEELQPQNELSSLKVKTQVFVKILPEDVHQLIEEWKDNGYDILSIGVSKSSMESQWYYDIIFHNSTRTISVGFVEMNSTMLNNTIREQEDKGLIVHVIVARPNGTMPLYSAVFRKRSPLMESHSYWDVPIHTHIIKRILLRKEGWNLMSQHFLTMPSKSITCAVYHRDQRTKYNLTIGYTPKWSVYYGFPFHYFTSITLDFLNQGYYPRHVSTYYYGEEKNARFSVIYETKQKEHPSYYRWIRWNINHTEVYSEIEKFENYWDLWSIIGYTHNEQLSYIMQWGLKIN